MVAQGDVEGNAAAGRNRAGPERPAGGGEEPAGRRQRHPRPNPRAECETHFRPFRNEEDFRIITATSSMLERSGFYWGPMSVEEAHSQLKGQPHGTFLVRDSQQKDVFFTLSYRSASGPISIRINFQASRFSLMGSKESFDSLFRLLEHYVASPKKSLTRPYRKERLRPLQDLCRQRIIQTWGSDSIDSIPVNAVLRDFLRSFPFRL